MSFDQIRVNQTRPFPWLRNINLFLWHRRYAARSNDGYVSLTSSVTLEKPCDENIRPNIHAPSFRIVLHFLMRFWLDGCVIQVRKYFERQYGDIHRSVRWMKKPMPDF